MNAVSQNLYDVGMVQGRQGLKLAQQGQAEIEAIASRIFCGPEALIADQLECDGLAIESVGGAIDRGHAPLPE